MIIRKIASIFLIFVALFVFSSCERDMNSDTDSTINKDDSINDYNSDTQIDTDVNTDSSVDTNTDNVTNDFQSSSEDLKHDTDTEMKDDEKNEEKIESFGNFTTLHKTLAANDRVKQMQYSKSVFNTGSKYTPDELKATRLQASIISSAKLLLPNASDFMEHYLKGSGENYELDIDDFLEDKTAKANMISDLNAALRAAENMATEDEKITIYQIEESLHHNLTGDWKYSVGSYFASVELYDVDVTETSLLGVTYYTARFKYVVQDFYNWDSNDTNKIISISSVSPADLHQLHVNGEAQEFLTYGEEEYEIRWVKGVDASTLKLNDND